MVLITSQITSLTIVYSIVDSDADQRKHQSSVSLAFVWGIHRGPVNSPRKWPVTPKMFPFDDVIILGKNKILKRIPDRHLIAYNNAICSKWMFPLISKAPLKNIQSQDIFLGLRSVTEI